ncbi:MAG: protein translocase subunit SecF [Candidatus Pacearchaeota archaeon]|jgi:preprotein translocase subunit SecF
MEENPEIQNKKNWHDKYYKILLIIPAVLIIFCLIYLGIFYSNNGDFIRKDISLTGGTTVTIYEKLDISSLESFLNDNLNEYHVREVSDLITRDQIAVIVETTADGDTAKSVLEKYLGHSLDENNSSFEFSESSFTRDFYKQLLIAVAIAFVLMSIVVFILFRNFVPSITVIFSVFADILMTITFVDIIGLKISTAGIVAFLMLIGYSVDTDILLTNRILKRHEGTLNEKTKGAFKTGITMTLTSLVAVVASLFVVKSFSPILTQIFLIISIGLVFDIINTWITNTSIIKWYVLSRKK